MKKELKILNTVSAMFIFATGLLGPIYAVYVEGIGGDLITTGTAYSIYAIASGALIFFLSKWENHLKHKEKIMIFGYLLGCLGFLGYLFVGNATGLFIVQLILGLATAIRVPIFDSLYSKNLDRGKYTSEWGVWESLNLIFIGISAIAGAFIANAYGFDALFITMFAVSFLGAIISLLLLMRKKR